jgi:hypothetical protein
LSDIIVVVRNERGVAMASIDGELVTVLLTSDGRVLAQQTVRFTVADAVFLDLSPGSYTVIVRHPSLNPTESRQDISLSDKLMAGVKYFYDESARQLLRIELDLRSLNV